MGDTYHDPIDHLRTTRPHAGRAVINVTGWPGYSMLVAGMMVFLGSLVAFGTGHNGQGMAIAGVAVVLAALGTAWLLVEHRRIDRVEQHWRGAHTQELTG